MPILRSLPVRNFGRTRVPRRFHSSAGMSPVNVIVFAVGPVGETLTAGSTTVGFPLSGPGPLPFGVTSVGSVSSGPITGFFFSSSALAFLSKKTPDSKAISSVGTGSLNQIRSNPPSGFGPDAKPNSPRPTNSTSLDLRTLSGSSKRVSAPFRKLCRSEASGQAPVSLKAGGQLRSM